MVLEILSGEGDLSKSLQQEFLEASGRFLSLPWSFWILEASGWLLVPPAGRFWQMVVAANSWGLVDAQDTGIRPMEKFFEAFSLVINPCQQMCTHTDS